MEDQTKPVETPKLSNVMDADTLADRVHDARTLLNFAQSDWKLILQKANRQDEVDEETAKTICKTEELLGKRPTPEQQVEFELAYQKLCSKLAPISVRTLRATSDSYARKVEHRERCRARRWATGLWICTLVFAALVVAFELTSMNRDPIQTSLQVLGAAIKTGQELVGQKEKELSKQKTALSPQDPVPPEVSARLAKQEKDLEARKQSHQDMQKALSVLEKGFNGKENLQEPSSWSFGGFFIMLAGYLLPFAYGGLGSCTYLLRKCVKYIGLREFDPQFTPEYTNRILVGAVSGGIVYYLFAQTGWLAKEVQGVQITAGLFGFIAGYFNQRLFQGLERVADAIIPRVTRRAAEEGEPTRAPVAISSQTIEKLVDELKKTSDASERKALTDLMQRLSKKVA